MIVRAVRIDYPNSIVDCLIVADSETSAVRQSSIVLREDDEVAVLGEGFARLVTDEALWYLVSENNPAFADSAYGGNRSL